jgi:glycosyltransferase involved in cell wall biosynthesis
MEAKIRAPGRFEANLHVGEPAKVRRMRVCVLSPHFPPDLSGMGDYTYFLANALGDIGCDVEVLTSQGELDPVLYPLGRGVRVHRIVQDWGIRGLSHLVRAARALHAEALLIQYTPHAFDRRGITLGVNILPWLLRVATRVRVIVNFHELYIPFDYSLKHCLGAVWQRFMAFVIAAGSHGLTAISSEWPRQLRRVGVWKSIQVIPVGSNIPRAIVSAAEIKAIRTRLGVDDATLLIGCFGSAGPDRDAVLLLAVLGELRREQSMKLVWLGKSGLHFERWARLDEAAGVDDDGGGIIRTGQLPHPEISRIMSACDLFVLPFTDGVSTKRGTLAAALLHGLPILSTRGKRLDEIFVHGENIYLVPPGDAQGFADGLTQLARCPKLRDRLARGARTLHDAHFAWDVIAKQAARSALEERRQ